eukprot:CAMPEP_0172512302 /NCGR_PEP_ID=MMETSP1066-20121228/243378_1 /TAXON_ID=671091 /ORGANISM="Coscinodiscus wailesii, Strain CCMP2513" /LENGTH=147 /DNA_ID=CAMNT_0013292047 /DNA_START=298 /DNA_END=737 /DNA_ORIENTATION=+
MSGERGNSARNGRMYYETEEDINEVSRERRNHKKKDVEHFGSKNEGTFGSREHEKLSHGFDLRPRDKVRSVTESYNHAHNLRGDLVNGKDHMLSRVNMSRKRVGGQVIKDMEGRNYSDTEQGTMPSKPVTMASAGAEDRKCDYNEMV